MEVGFAEEKALLHIPLGRQQEMVVKAQLVTVLEDAAGFDLGQ